MAGVLTLPGAILTSALPLYKDARCPEGRDGAIRPMQTGNAVAAHYRFGGASGQGEAI